MTADLPASEGTQDAPAMDQHPTTDAEKADGIIAQTRADLGGVDAAEFERVLRQRFAEAGVTATDEEFAAYAARGD